MPIIGFTTLLDKLMDGTKTQTIRKPRKQPLKIGDTLHVFWRLRTKKCEKLGEAKIIKIERKQVVFMTKNDAVKDGFNNQEELWMALSKMHPKTKWNDEFDIITFEWTKKEWKQ